jgi:TorA maturation chaperone TorD
MAWDVTVVKREQNPDSRGCSLYLDKIEAFRDFFYSSGGHEIMQSFKRLSRLFKEKIGSDISWLEIEFQFNRLFVGPGQVTAPPYASVYLEKQPVLMGPTTLGIRCIYASLELEVPDKGRIPDDFIAYELDALNVILTRDPLDVAVLEQLLDRHMIQWIPKFCESCRQQHLLDPLEKMIEWLELTIKALHMGMRHKTKEKKAH